MSVFGLILQDKLVTASFNPHYNLLIVFTIITFSSSINNLLWLLSDTIRHLLQFATPSIKLLSLG